MKLTRTYPQMWAEFLKLTDSPTPFVAEAVEVLLLDYGVAAQPATRGSFGNQPTMLKVFTALARRGPLIGDFRRMPLLAVCVNSQADRMPESIRDAFRHQQRRLNRLILSIHHGTRRLGLISAPAKAHTVTVNHFMGEPYVGWVDALREWVVFGDDQAIGSWSDPPELMERVPLSRTLELIRKSQ